MIEPDARSTLVPIQAKLTQSRKFGQNYGFPPSQGQDNVEKIASSHSGGRTKTQTLSQGSGYAVRYFKLYGNIHR
jgi:hypothetical protein